MRLKRKNGWKRSFELRDEDPETNENDHLPNEIADVNVMFDFDCKEKFEVPPGMDYWMLQFIGHRWRNWKAVLKARHYVENAPLDFQNQSVDSRVVEDQWRDLIDYWKTDEAKATSKRNKEIRKKKTMHHRTGKKSYAQIYDEKSKDDSVMQPPSRVVMFKACYLDKNKNARSSDVANAVKQMDERSSQLPAGHVDEIAPDDVFAQVIGKDRNGRVRMMGGGVAPSDLWDNFPSRGSNYRMCMEYKSALEWSEERYSEQAEINKKLMAELAEIRALVNQQRSSPSVNTSAVRSASSVQKHAQTSRSLQVNGYVAMKSRFDVSKTVAEGYLQSLDPTCVVGGQALGKNSCSVLIQVAVHPLEELFRPFDMFETIGDTIGLAIAWPKNLVFTIDED